MDASTILKYWLSYSEYVPNATKHNLLSPEWDFHRLNQAITGFMSYNPTGEFAVIYAKKSFEKILHSYKASFYDIVTKPESYRKDIDMWQLFSSPSYMEIETQVLNELNEILESVLPTKQIGCRDLTAEKAALAKAVCCVVEELPKCNIDLFLRGGEIQRFTNFSTHVLIFNYLSECLITLKKSPDGIYLCYIDLDNSCDGYFGFYIKSNGTILSINERINEQFPGEHRGHRNNRYVEAKKYGIFPYSMIAFSEETDYKGYSLSQKIDPEKSSIFTLEATDYLPIILAMALLRNRYTGESMKNEEIHYVDSLLQVNLNAPLPGTSALTIPNNSQLAAVNRGYQIPFTDADILDNALAAKYFTCRQEVTEYFGKVYHAKDTNLFLEKYAKGFHYDPQKAMLRNSHLRSLPPDDLEKALATNGYSEFIAPKEKMDKIAYWQGRNQLAEYMRDNIYDAYQKAGGVKAIKKWWNVEILKHKETFLAMCAQYTPTKSEKYRKNFNASYNGEEFQLHADFTPQSSVYPFNVSKGLYSDDYLCCITQQKATYQFSIYIKTYGQLCALCGKENVPDILEGFNESGHDIMGNSILYAVDPIPGVGLPFERTEKEKNPRFHCNDWVQQCKNNPEFHFNLSIALSKRGLNRIKKQYGGNTND